MNGTPYLFFKSSYVVCVHVEMCKKSCLQLVLFSLSLSPFLLCSSFFSHTHISRCIRGWYIHSVWFHHDDRGSSRLGGWHQHRIDYRQYPHIMCTFLQLSVIYVCHVTVIWSSISISFYWSSSQQPSLISLILFDKTLKVLQHLLMYIILMIQCLRQNLLWR